TPLDPCVMMPCAVPAAQAAPARVTIKVHGEEGKCCLEMSTPDGTCATCKRLTLERGEAGKVHLHAGKARVHLGGCGWKAKAGEAERGADGKVTLTGHAGLCGQKGDDCTKIKARRICMSLRDGKVHTYLADQQAE